MTKYQKYSSRPGFKGKRREEQMRYYKWLRRDVLIHLGGPICVRCRYNKDSRALCIDHIYGDGYIERRNKDNASIVRSILKLAPEDARKRYQVLCANCNLIKKIENREHEVKFHTVTDDSISTTTLGTV